MILFLALCLVGVAVAGVSAFLIFWPLTLVHVRDRHPAIAATLGEGAFLRPSALAWLLRRRYRDTADPALSGLATPAWLSLLVVFAALGLAALLGLISEVTP